MAVAAQQPSIRDEILAGDGLTLAQVAASNTLRRRGNGRLNPATVWTWCVKGMPTPSGRRVHLEHVRMGRTYYTSQAAVRRFFSALMDASPDPILTAQPAPSQVERVNAQTQAGEILDRAGI